MKFDFCIGNPPYQNTSLGDNETYAPPVYNTFMDAAFSVSDHVELIHPARFLFGAGSTPKDWNNKMLNDEHFKVLAYEQDSSKIFPDTTIKGGVAITYRDSTQSFGAIGTFTASTELRNIMNKTLSRPGFSSFADIVTSAYSNKFTEKLHEDHPDAASLMSVGHAYDLKSNVFEKLPMVFLTERPTDKSDDYYCFIGVVNNRRTTRYIKKEYVREMDIMSKYKILMPAANGTGSLGETLSAPIIGEPFFCGTETFISIGSFDTRAEAEAALKYVKSKFARALLGILKITQHITPQKWKYVPLQNFTSTSDIDWTKPVAQIDQQLYEKYDLTEEEILFIETNVKEME